MPVPLQVGQDSRTVFVGISSIPGSILPTGFSTATFPFPAQVEHVHCEYAAFAIRTNANRMRIFAFFIVLKSI